LPDVFVLRDGFRRFGAFAKGGYQGRDLVLLSAEKRIVAGLVISKRRLSEGNAFLRLLSTPVNTFVLRDGFRRFGAFAKGGYQGRDLVLLSAEKRIPYTGGDPSGGTRAAE